MRLDIRLGRAGLLAAMMMSVAAPPSAQTPPQHDAPLSFNLYGLPGLVDMPTAQTMPDAQVAATIGGFDHAVRRTLAFQIMPRVTGSFRYSTLDDFNANEALFDRSFDLRYLLLKETRLRPAVAIGLQDFIGTGVYSGEYVVATKTLPGQVTVTGGLGWGRLASRDPIGTLGSRPPRSQFGQGGTPNADRFFQGDVAPFGGIAWSPTDRLTFKAEYSSDAYTEERAAGIFDATSAVNLGVDYRFRNGTQLSLYHMHGEAVGFQVTVQTNPKTLGVPGGQERAPLPVEVRAPGASSDLGWTQEPDRATAATAELKLLAAGEGLVVEGLRLEPRRATVRLLNPRYGAPAQAIGRLARAMTRTMPASVETFEIVPVVDGMALSSVILERSDLEALEHEAAVDILAQARIVDGFGRAPAADPGQYPKFLYSISPFVDLSFFDPNSPVRYNSGIRASIEAAFHPAFVLSGSVKQRVAGNTGDEPASESGLPRVRTDSARYADEGETALEYLQIAGYARPAENLYGRLTLGYLEPMYAGASAELLWKPVDSRLGIGAEVNYVQRRDFDQQFGLQDMTTVDPVTGIRRTIPDVNGHLSAYYDFGNGFHGEVNAGRFLAGDVGARFALDREFANGIRIGAFATLTDASAEEFGEGSFDKGLRFTVPLSVLTGQPTRTTSGITLRSLTRDGGAMLNVRGRLYETVRDYHEEDTVESWGRFWR